MPRRFLAYPLIAASTFLVGITSAFLLSHETPVELVPDSSARVQRETIDATVFPRVWYTADTISGKVSVVETSRFEWAIYLDDWMYRAGSGLPPYIESVVTLEEPKRRDVVIFTEDGGTYCEFEEFFLDSFDGTKTVSTSRNVGHGFGYPMAIRSSRSTIDIAIRDGHVNGGSERLPGGNWRYFNGKLRKLK